ncbi:5-methyltetrahydropteroyltriglutamate--homocysteine methyltransferase [Metallosphaera sedula]|uniref:5-methyltetrahydropteroyltriglutamate--homocysteine methyltransferase n=1 Tax=Metallosphaera sedula TaxID=43687 RepID=A0A0K1SSW4_9CREN|nr:5-methyltetrahydropteroyltriglutamate--homocysteine methyltransferase [Metallosphaera sedula]AKV77673.1 5-methyltetrahydropteroyltriglutamate--homocysteine methyltransferase [Metallosphaera sedula]AKV79918.1 5-methyltetrahydropteroyltriglutamate--homocysteine methyltransferase [Metallosphaera sedula]AKV82163.1 5-methyltetrahydropteroyltriglutamate--homocysteine methyltransferase [Metallosphaera sedula]AKV84413.1 5-methyltetrahydropteroyltriglutamate--homocysteine methyltransferase [Metallosp
MKFTISIVGSYPRAISLGKVFSRYRSGKISKEVLDKEIIKRTTSFMSLVKDVGASYTTDGLLRWDDLMDITFSYISGPTKGELMRFYDNNFYYRKPVIKGDIKAQPDEYLKSLQEDMEIAKKVGYTGKLKAVLVGPLTYTLLSDNRHYDDEELVFAYAKEVNSVMKAIPSGLAIEIHEPSFFEKGIKTSTISRLVDAYSEMVKGVNQEKHLVTYFTINPSKLDTFFKLPVDVHGLDVVENMNLLAQVYARIAKKRVFFGVLNTRNTKLERLSTIRRIVNKGYQKGATQIIVGNAAPMDFIPEIIAVRKLKLLKKLGDKS